MSKAVRYDEFGGIDVLRVDEVDRPVPGDGKVLVRVKAAGINPSEAVIRTGAVADLFPSTFPSGQGSDLAGVVEEVGAGAGGFSPGDEVIGFSNNRASQAELVLVVAGDLTRKPEKVSWEVAGRLYVAGVTAWGRYKRSSSRRARPSSSPEPPGESARSPSSSRAEPGPRPSAWRASATTNG
jgi:NADPH:quinone reductase-like Zn-dependent oxidoreductase